MITDAPSLRDLRVLVTRPEPLQQELVDAIEARGGSAVSLPLLDIEPITDAKAQQVLRRLLLDLDQYQLLIFISSNAVHHGCDLIEQYWPQFPVGVELFAVGPSTASVLQQRLGLNVQHSPTGMDSEALLDLPRLTAVAGQKIAVFRGEGGRELLASTLRQRGARVDYLEVYRRRSLSYPAQTLADTFGPTGVNVLTVTSGQSLTQLHELTTAHRQRLSLLPLLVPSPRLAEQARQLGFQNTQNAGGADTASMIATLQEIAARADT
jgi:uroporphyrinogen-III synthase